ncbi:aldo/keto reductase [Metapseudomonas lalkuanensis]|nr:aldo/keto reductase [Pseudomonas lalkuanensis]
MHWPPQSRDMVVDTWRAMIKIPASGQARSIGVPNFAIQPHQRILDEAGIMPTVNQVDLHPSFQQVELRNFHKTRGATQSWNPLGVWRNLFPPLIDSAILSIAKKHGRTPAQIIMR